MPKRITFFILTVLLSIMPVSSVSKKAVPMPVSSCSADEIEIEYDDGGAPIVIVF